MDGKWCTFLLSLTVVIHCGSAANSQYYTAAVAEYRPAVSGASSAQLLEENLLAYLELIKSANGTTDIIVFPEGTLNTLLQLTAVPPPSTLSLCHLEPELVVDLAEFMQRLACAAVEAKTYLVFNVKEREACHKDLGTDTDCPLRGYRLYNTNVVFDRSGAIVSRYRKWNLYLEPQLNRTAKPEYGIFVTDFGVTFGHFICFDMLFYTPAMELVREHDIQNIIVTKMFNSELPFLTASQLQQGWAWANNVNLLAAGASLPHGGITGSGIYAGQRGALVRRMVGNATVGARQLLVSRVAHWPSMGNEDDVPTDVEQPGPAQRELLMLQEPQLLHFVSWQVPLNYGSLLRKRLCHSDLCCDFELSLEQPQTEELPSSKDYEYLYRLGVYVGQRDYEEKQYSVVRLCGLFACTNSSITSCGQLRQWAWQGAQLQFNTLRVSGDFVRRKRQLLMPSTLSGALYALQPTELAWMTAESVTSTYVQLQLQKPHSQLLAFGIYGNFYDDAVDGNESGGATNGGGFGLVVACLVFLQIATAAALSKHFAD